MKQDPLISIIIPCYNQGKYLTIAVKSIISQTYSNWECIIMDDGSTDDTFQIARELYNHNSRVKYYHKTNGGLSNARNEGIRKAKGEFIQFLDADDFLEKDKLQISLNNIIKDPLCKLVISNFVRCTEDDAIRTPPYCDLSAIDFNFESILLNWDKTFTIPIHCALFKSELFENYLFKEDIGAKEDWLMWLHIFSASPIVAFINLPLVVYREHDKSMSYNKLLMYENTARVFTYVMNIIDEKYKQLFFDKVNTYWQNETLFLQSHISNHQNNEKKMYQSLQYRLGKYLLLPFSYLNNKVLNLFYKNSSKINL
jgi:glycosyltransferase involved in cell wall biosynthesis